MLGRPLANSNKKKCLKTVWDQDIQANSVRTGSPFWRWGGGGCNAVRPLLAIFMFSVVNENNTQEPWTSILNNNICLCAYMNLLIKACLVVAEGRAGILHPESSSNNNWGYLSEPLHSSRHQSKDRYTHFDFLGKQFLGVMLPLLQACNANAQKTVHFGTFFKK